MKIPRDLSGEEVVRKLKSLGFVELRQSGSHVIIQHVDSGETISVPAHRPLKVGTLSAIISDVMELTNASREEVLSHLK